MPTLRPFPRFALPLAIALLPLAAQAGPAWPFRGITEKAMNMIPGRLPGVGDIAGIQYNHAASIDDEEFGRSVTVPSITEIPVSSRKPRSPFAQVGHLVKKELFGQGYPDFIFNVSFSAGEEGYADPSSIWNNVFFGYYEIDVPASWGRPFGYAADTDPGQPRRIEYEDLARIGKADWNFFSNYMYGVPLAAVLPYSQVDMGQLRIETHEPARIGGGYWDSLLIDGVDVVSASTPEPKRLRNNSVLSPVWRKTFGLRPGKAPEGSPDFPGTPMKAAMLLSYRKVAWDADLKGPAYQTFIFGGTVRADYPDAERRDRFLKLQMDAVKRVIQERFSRLGFRSN
jgi:hypothetical protein